MRELHTVVLASVSPRRRELLSSLGLRVLVVPSYVAEGERPGHGPLELARFYASAKAEAVARRRSEDLTVAADTVVDLDGLALGKPADASEAAEMLQRLAGRRHAVHSAYLRDRRPERPAHRLRRDDPGLVRAARARDDRRLRRHRRAARQGRRVRHPGRRRGAGRAHRRRLFTRSWVSRWRAFVRALPELGYRARTSRDRERTVSWAGSLRSTVSPDIGIDLGTANTVVYERGGRHHRQRAVGGRLRRRSDADHRGRRTAPKNMDGRAPEPDPRRAPAARRDDLRLSRRAHADPSGSSTARSRPARAHRAAPHRLRSRLRDRHRVQGRRGGRARRRCALHDLRSASRRGGDRRRARHHRAAAADGRRHRRRDDRDRGPGALRRRRAALDQDRRRHLRRARSQHRLRTRALRRSAR